MHLKCVKKPCNVRDYKILLKVDFVETPSILDEFKKT